MRACLVVCHPDPGSFNHALAKAMAQAWTERGAEVRVHDLHADGFDPVLTLDEVRGRATDDPIVLQHMLDLAKCDLLGVVHPNCWGAPPAMMKGWIDRVFAPDAAYAFAKGCDQADQPLGLLRARVAVVLNTGNTPLARERNAFGDPLDAMWRRCILDYCGVPDVRRTLFGPLATSTPEKRAAWLAEAGALAADALYAATDPVS